MLSGIPPGKVAQANADQPFVAFRLAFLRLARAASFRAGLALNFTVAPAFTATFSPVPGFKAVRFGVSRTTKARCAGA